MVTPLAILIAITVVCLLASALMLLIMLLHSPGRRWHRRLDKGSIACGLFTIAFGIFEFTMHRKAEREQKIVHYRRAPVTPAQGYAAAAGFVFLGAITVLVAVVHGRVDSGQSPGSPTI